MNARSPHRRQGLLKDLRPRTGLLQSRDMKRPTQDTPKLYKMSRATDLTLTVIWRTTVTILSLWFILNGIWALNGKLL